MQRKKIVDKLMSRDFANDASLGGLDMEETLAKLEDELQRLKMTGTGEKDVLKARKNTQKSKSKGSSTKAIKYLKDTRDYP